MSDAQSGPGTAQENLSNWWEQTKPASLSRSEWSIILDRLEEQASMDELGDHIDQRTARKTREIMAHIQEQVETSPPQNLTRAAYQEGADDAE